MSEKNKVLVIVGPTASGKSDLAVKLAKKFDGEIISADSRQVYKGLDVGTGKITKKEMQHVPHYLLSVANPQEQLSAAEYKEMAERALAWIESRDKLPIIVGGTGFYIDALTGRTNFPNVPANKKLREKLQKKSSAELFEMLKKKDPSRAWSIDQHNKVRLIRALEIIEAIGKVPKLQEAKHQEKFIWIGLKPEKKDLEKKIYTRLLARLSGMIREAKRLHANGLSYTRMEELGLEYRYLAQLLQKKLTKEKFIEKLFLEIKHYAKRQETWFKKNKEIHWFTLPLSSSDVDTIRHLLE